MIVARWSEIEAALAGVDVVAEMERAFVAYAQGRSVVPPPGELVFEQPPGDVHLKYGYLRGDEHYVIKIASGFYENPARGLPSSQGMMLLFRQATGEPVAVLLDEGRLTDVRTAAAGAVAAKYLAPRSVKGIGILGTGTQARRQLELLQGVVDCDRVLVWGRRDDARRRYRDEMEPLGFTVETTDDRTEVAAACNLIVTTTPATAPLLEAAWIRPVGSDTAAKQELDAAILARAHRVVADSLAQCRERGEIAHALRAGALAETDVVELGAVIDGTAPGRTDDDEVTVADLTGVAVQDVQIAAAVFARLT